MTVTKICAKCGKVILSGRSDKRYCGESCRAATHYLRRRGPLALIPCFNCGVPIERTCSKKRFCNNCIPGRLVLNQRTYAKTEIGAEKIKIYRKKRHQSADYKEKMKKWNFKVNKPKQRERQSKVRENLGDEYIKRLLKHKRRGICISNPTPEIIELKRIHITLKRNQRERKNEQPINP